MNIFSNPVFLLVGGFIVFLFPRIIRLVAGVSLVTAGLIGLYAKSEGFLESE